MAITKTDPQIEAVRFTLDGASVDALTLDVTFRLEDEGGVELPSRISARVDAWSEMSTAERTSFSAVVTKLQAIAAGS